MKSNSQSGQDLFVLHLIDTSEKRTFVDVGCNKPFFINNTALLEEYGWYGVSIDIMDFSHDWSYRKTPFIIKDALNTDYAKLFLEYKLPQVVDYLNVDIEGNGDRYKALNAVMNSKFEFKVITVEHDSYRGYYETETVPQRKLLNSLGYTLLCSNVCNMSNPYEDWWINPKYITKNLEYLRCDNLEYTEIINKLKPN
jgi:hypothetical protein